MTKEYKHVISLGHACAVAHEMEHLGFRDHSGPFDWLASTRLEPKIDFIKNGFKTFFEDLTPQELYQRRVPSAYMMKDKFLYFIHDFNEYDSLEKQLPAVRAKFERRVKSFYEDVKEPTLFVYYLSDDPEDAKWIDENADYIIEVLRSFNPANDILYLADPKVKFAQPCFYVENDEGSDIAYDFTKKSDEILNFFEHLPYSAEQRERNIAFFKRNQMGGAKKLKKKIRMIYLRLTHKVYRHSLVSLD